MKCEPSAFSARHAGYFQYPAGKSKRLPDARAPKEHFASCAMPGIENTRQMNGRPTDARTPKKHFASCAGRLLFLAGYFQCPAPHGSARERSLDRGTIPETLMRTELKALNPIRRKFRL